MPLVVVRERRLAAKVVRIKHRGSRTACNSGCRR
jgi:hypothetical protein